LRDQTIASYILRCPPSRGIMADKCAILETTKSDISFSDKASMNLTKVLLVIEVPLIGNIFSSVLEDEPDITIVGCVATLPDALEFIKTQEVDVVLVSVGLPGQDSLTLISTIVDRTPSTKVLVLGLSDEDKNSALLYIEAGAAGYVLKDSSLKEFIEIIRLTQKGEAQVSTKIAGAMMERLSNLARMFSSVENRIDGDVRLTSRELEVLQYIGEGLTNQEIAARLVVEVGTVKNHVHSILEKLNVSSRDDAASYLAFIKR
jgi:DNA-binding NarL/FixJ family response regulator